MATSYPTGYYGAQDKGLDVTEESPPGEGFAAKLCEQWEEAVDLDEELTRKVVVRIGE